MYLPISVFIQAINANLNKLQLSPSIGGVHLIRRLHWALVADWSSGVPRDSAV